MALKEIEDQHDSNMGGEAISKIINSILRNPNQSVDALLLMVSSEENARKMMQCAEISTLEFTKVYWLASRVGGQH